MNRWSYAGLLLIGLSEIVIPQLVHVDHAHFWFEDLPAWGSIYGLLSCVLIIVVSKALGKVLTRRENYYDS